MNDETPINQEKGAPRRQRRLPEPFGAISFAFQERVAWPLQDRFAQLGLGPNRAMLLGGGAVGLFLVGVVAVLALSSGGGSSAPATTATEAAAPREPLIAAAPKRTPAKEEAPRETLHGATPVFTPRSPVRKGGVKAGKPKAAEGEPSSETPTSASSPSSSPGSARISSHPKNSKSAEGATASSAARAAVPEGPPAGAAALKVAREFAQGFVVYETGGETSGFRDAFKASAIPQLTKALLKRPPKQPAGVKVPRAKVLNVVAGPSQGSVYKVSVSLLRVGVTSELRLDMERIKTAGKSGKRAEWRVTNVLG
jgi:hypothetical protein